MRLPSMSLSTILPCAQHKLPWIQFPFNCRWRWYVLFSHSLVRCRVFSIISWVVISRQSLLIIFIKAMLSKLISRGDIQTNWLNVIKILYVVILVVISSIHERKVLLSFSSILLHLAIGISGAFFNTIKFGHPRIIGVHAFS
jgi:hypothetical protein